MEPRTRWTRGRHATIWASAAAIFLKLIGLFHDFLCFLPDRVVRILAVHRWGFALAFRSLLVDESESVASFPFGSFAFPFHEYHSTPSSFITSFILLIIRHCVARQMSTRTHVYHRNLLSCFTSVILNLAVQPETSSYISGLCILW